MPDEPNLLARLLGDYVVPAVSGIGNVLDTYSGASSLRDWIAGEDPWDQLADPLNEEKKVTGRQLLEKRGWADENEDQGWVPDLGDLGGFAAEMLLDPTNLLGGAGLAKRLMGISKAKAANRGIEAANALSREQRAMGFMPEEVAKLTKIVDETGQPKKMYHGTTHAWEGSPDPSKWDDEALYGRGHYTTDNPLVAGGDDGYTGRGWTTARPVLDEQETLDRLWDRMEEAKKAGILDDDSYNYLSVKNASLPRPGKWNDVAFTNDKAGIPVHDLFEPNPAFVRSHYIDSRQPLTIEELNPTPSYLRKELRSNKRHLLQQDIEQIRRARDIQAAADHGSDAEFLKELAWNPGNLTPKQMEGLRLRQYESAIDQEDGLKMRLRSNFAKRNEIPAEMLGEDIYDRVGASALRNLGYDSIRHTGGALTGGVPHNVVIALDPKNVYLPYIAKELQDLQHVASPNSLIAKLAGYNALAHSDLETDE